MEKWKNIKNFEGLYQISNLGRIKSLRRTVDTTKYKKIVEEKEMKESCPMIKTTLFELII